MPVASAFSDIRCGEAGVPCGWPPKTPEAGDIETAEAIEVAQRHATDAPISFEVLDGLFKPKPWQHTAQCLRIPGRRVSWSAAAYDSPCGQHCGGCDAEEQPSEDQPESARVASYPGGGQHRFLFDFCAQNQLPELTEDLHFIRRCACGKATSRSHRLSHFCSHQRRAGGVIVPVLYGQRQERQRRSFFWISRVGIDASGAQHVATVR